MQDFTPEELNKLPQWAQRKIKDLQISLLTKTEELERILKEQPQSDIYYKSPHGNNIYLPEYHGDVCFSPEPGFSVNANVIERGSKKRIEIRVGWESNGNLVVLPVGANAIEVVVQK